MEEKYIKAAKRLEELPDFCFIKQKDGSYNLTVKNKESQLPVVPKKYEPVLKKCYIDSYKVFQIEKKGKKYEYCKYWDKYLYKEETVELPVYEYRGGRYYLSGMKKDKIPTEASVTAANRLKVKVDSEIRRIKEKNRISHLNRIMQERSAAYFNSSEFKDDFEEGQYGNFYIFVVNGKKKNYLIVFDLDKIYDEDEILLKLPYQNFEKVLGENNCNAEYWVDYLDLPQLRIEFF